MFRIPARKQKQFLPILLIFYLFVCFIIWFPIINKSNRSNNSTGEILRTKILASKRYSANSSNKSGTILVQDDAALVKYVKEHVLEQPPPLDQLSAPETIESNRKDGELRKLKKSSYRNQTFIVLKLLTRLNKTTNGFFVEYGTVHKHMPKTSYFENRLKWNGLILEEHRKFYLNKLQTPNRKVWTANACLSSNPYVKVPGRDLKILLKTTIHNRITKKNVTQCFPFYTFLLALGRDTVDYFVLGHQAEGKALLILETIPFDLVKILIIQVEVNKDNKIPIKEFLLSVGYTLYTNINENYIFIHESVKNKVKLSKKKSQGLAGQARNIVGNIIGYDI